MNGAQCAGAAIVGRPASRAIWDPVNSVELSTRLAQLTMLEMGVPVTRKRFRRLLPICGRRTAVRQLEEYWEKARKQLFADAIPVGQTGRPGNSIFVKELSRMSRRRLRTLNTGARRVHV